MLECALVRAPVIIFLLPMLAAVGASADVIHLKNGRTIWADQARENGARVEYDIGDNSYAIPKSAVERIEGGGVRQGDSSSSGNSSGDMPAFAPTDSLKNEAVVTHRIIHDDKVDVDALAELQKQSDMGVTAAGYFAAGKYEFDKGNFSKARPYLETAERAVRAAPDSPDALDILGYAQFAADRNRDAIRTWKRSLEIRPDAMVQQYLDKAERETKAEADFSERETSHFTLRYEGKQTSESLRRELIATLEAAYDDLSRDLGGAIRNSIPVVLYTEQAFFDVTQAPAWSAAVNDGKLRIPVEGVSSVTPELARVLKHELAHSFINQISGGRCPQWLHEGIAQAMEPKSVASRGRRLAALYRAHQEIPFNGLEGSFMRFSPAEALLAYDESLATVEFISDTSGMSDFHRILERIGQGSSTEAALRTTIHSDYGQLEGEVAKYLSSKYGE